MSVTDNSIIKQASDKAAEIQAEHGTANLIAAGVGGITIMAAFNMVKGWFVDEQEQSFFGKVGSGLLSIGVLAGSVFGLLQTKAGDKVVAYLDKDPSNDPDPAKALAEAKQKLTGLTEDAFQGIDDFSEYLQQQYGMAADKADEVVEAVEGLDGTVGDGFHPEKVPINNIPKVISEAVKAL